MTRPLRIEYPGALYHVTARGNAQQDVFLNDHDRLLFLDVAGNALASYKGICHAYCLMSNHYHLLLETPDGNLSQLMRQINGVYTQRFNGRHGRVGHVFQGRFKAIIVDKDEYLLQLCRYIVLNPVRAKMVHAPGQYEWSSYNATAGKTQGPDWLFNDWLLSHFGQDKAAAQYEYRRFVSAGLATDSPWGELKGQCLLGGEAFVEKLLPHLRAKQPLRDIPIASRHAHRPALADIFTPTAIATKRTRNEAIRSACLDHGYKQRDIAEHLDLHYTTVSNILRGKTLK